METPVPVGVKAVVPGDVGVALVAVVVRPPLGFLPLQTWLVPVLLKPR